MINLVRNSRIRSRKTNTGFTLLIAIITMGTLLLVASGIVSSAVRSSFIYSSARESQHAFYAADTGAECALFWDAANPSGFSAFATSTTASITCNGQTFNGMGGSEESEFTMTFMPDPYCARVVVTKPDDSNTIIESFGYNTCDSESSRRVERAVKVTY